MAEEKVLLKMDEEAIMPEVYLERSSMGLKALTSSAHTMRTALKTKPRFTGTVSMIPEEAEEVSWFSFSDSSTTFSGCDYRTKYTEDALHIGVAAVNGMEVLVTWNFAHLNNPFTRMMVRQVVENAGYQCPEICSPEELLEMES